MRCFSLLWRYDSIFFRYALLISSGGYQRSLDVIEGHVVVQDVSQRSPLLLRGRLYVSEPAPTPQSLPLLLKARLYSSELTEGHAIVLDVSRRSPLLLRDRLDFSEPVFTSQEPASTPQSPPTAMPSSRTLARGHLYSSELTGGHIVVPDVGRRSLLLLRARLYFSEPTFTPQSPPLLPRAGLYSSEPAPTPQSPPLLLRARLYSSEPAFTSQSPPLLHRARLYSSEPTPTPQNPPLLLRAHRRSCYRPGRWPEVTSTPRRLPLLIRGHRYSLLLRARHYSPELASSSGGTSISPGRTSLL
jgi:hypothetical protein